MIEYYYSSIFCIFLQTSNFMNQSDRNKKDEEKQCGTKEKWPPKQHGYSLLASVIQPLTRKLRTEAWMAAGYVLASVTQSHT